MPFLHLLLIILWVCSTFLNPPSLRPLPAGRPPQDHHRLPDAHHPGAAVGGGARGAGHRKVHPRRVRPAPFALLLCRRVRCRGAECGVARSTAVHSAGMLLVLCPSLRRPPIPHNKRNPPPPPLLQPAAPWRASSLSRRTQITWKCTNEQQCSKDPAEADVAGRQRRQQRGAACTAWGAAPRLVSLHSLPHVSTWLNPACCPL